ncbi:MAG TPA: type II toxin-antitoxin system RelE/ParE family toxin [Pseudacidobacterium sp.]|nr:type II toxin-antitoxin system RelE/ParE family toxin [Pseudacidobacterium sp.]
MAWTIKFDPSAEKELDKLDPQIARRILKFLFQRLAILEDPRSIGEALHGPRFGELWKYRVGDYRLICSLQDEVLTILVLRIGHRREVYER